MFYQISLHFLSLAYSNCQLSRVNETSRKQVINDWDCTETWKVGRMNNLLVNVIESMRLFNKYVHTDNLFKHGVLNWQKNRLP